MRENAARNGYEVAEVFIEPGASGTDDNRKEFQRMIQRIQAGPKGTYFAVLVLASSRFMRDATKSRVYKEALRKRGVRVISINQETNDENRHQAL